MTTTVVNNSLFRSLFEKQKLTGNNFLEWYHNLRIVLSTEDKLPFLEQPIPVLPVPPQRQANPHDVITTYQAWVKAQKESARLRLMTKDPKIQKTLEYLGAYDMLKELKTFYIDNLESLGCAMTQNLSVNLILVSLRKEYEGFVQNYNMHSIGKTVNELHRNQKKKSHKAAKGNQWKGKAKIGYVPVHALPFAPKPKNPPTPKKDNTTKDAICHQCGKVGHWRRNCLIYLSELMKKKKLSQGASTSGIFTIELYSFPSTSWVYDTSCGTHICITTQGLKGIRKLKPGALSLYVGDGHRATIEAIGDFHFCLLSGLVLILHNCHYAPSITKGIISISRLYKDGFLNHFKDDNSIFVFKNNMIYFNVIPRDDIYEIVMSSSNTNECSMYVVTNKRAKLNLDSALFKMARKPYSHQVESAKGLLGLIHTDVCGPFKIRQGAYYFSTFTDDFSRYGYVYLLKHKHEVFETFKVFQKKVENQLRKTIKSLRSDRGVWGCEALVKRDTLTKPDKLEPRALKCIFVGYPKKTMGYSFYYPPKNKVLVAWNAEFFENEVIEHKASGSLEDLEIIQEEDTHYSLDTSLNHEEDDQEIDEPKSDINPIRRSTRTRRPTDQLCLYVDAEEHELGDLGEPANYKAALLDPESDKWLNAMNVEMQSMKDNEVWELVDLPPNGKTVGHKWLFKKKTDMDGAVHTYKARLVAKGFTQTLGIDYEETFSPVADIRAIRILIAIAAFYDYEIWQIDVKTAFLNGYLNEEVYMEQPEGFVSQKYPNRVCKLKRSIYGLKQASRQWNKRFDDEIKKFGFNQNRDEPCVYVKASGSYVTFLILYVDDILIMGNNIPMLQDNPCDKHWTDVKNILKYLRNTKDMFLIYGGDMKRELRVSCYTDAGYLTDADDMKSQTGYVFVLNGGDVDWKSTNQSIFATSSIDAEYITAFDASKEALWIQKFIYGLGVVPTIEEPINMYCDNTGTIAIAKDHGVTKGARHFRAKVNYLQETIEMGDVGIEKLTQMTT
ncbi:retrotransposon protein, putative, ty1-copia subclass [Tanacetum coccineum]